MSHDGESAASCFLLIQIVYIQPFSPATRKADTRRAVLLEEFDRIPGGLFLPHRKLRAFSLTRGCFGPGPVTVCRPAACFHRHADREAPSFSCYWSPHSVTPGRNEISQRVATGKIRRTQNALFSFCVTETPRRLHTRHCCHTLTFTQVSKIIRFIDF